MNRKSCLHHRRGTTGAADRRLSVIDAADRPWVWVPLNGILQDVVRHESEPLADGYLLRTTSAVGEMISSCVRVCDRRPPDPPKDAPGLRLYIPQSPETRHMLRSHFLYIPRFLVVQLTGYLDAWFRLSVRQWFYEGRSRGFTQKQICEALIQEYGLWSSEDNFSMLKKMDYRERRKLADEVRSRLCKL